MKSGTRNALQWGETDRMKRSILLVAALFLCQPAIADQNSKELPELFGKLLKAESPQQAVLIETEIWKHWYERDEDNGGKKMTNAIDAMGTGRYTVALTLLDELVDNEADYAEAWNRRATVHYLLGNYNQSLSDIENTLKLEPRHFGAISGIGMIMLKIGQTDKALHAFERVLDISPQNVGASKSVKQLETKLGPSI